MNSRRVEAPTPPGLCVVPEPGDTVKTITGQSLGFVWEVVGSQIEVRSYNVDGGEMPSISRYHVLDVGKRIVISELNDAKGDERKVIE